MSGNVLITGGSGFIGSRIADILGKMSDSRIVVYDIDAKDGRTGNVASITGDVFDSDKLLKVLREGGASEGRTILLKLPPNWEMRSHSHTTLEQHYVLEGAYESQGKVFSAGSYQRIPKKTNHGPFTSRSGAVVLIMWDPVGT